VCVTNVIISVISDFKLRPYGAEEQQLTSITYQQTSSCL